MDYVGWFHSHYERQAVFLGTLSNTVYYIYISVNQSNIFQVQKRKEMFCFAFSAENVSHKQMYLSQLYFLLYNGGMEKNSLKLLRCFFLNIWTYETRSTEVCICPGFEYPTKSMPQDHKFWSCFRVLLTSLAKGDDQVS